MIIYYDRYNYKLSSAVNRSLWGNIKIQIVDTLFDNFIHPTKLLLKSYYISKLCNHKNVFIKLCSWLSFNLILLWCFHLNILCGIKKKCFFRVKEIIKTTFGKSCQLENRADVRKLFNIYLKTYLCNLFENIKRLPTYLNLKPFIFYCHQPYVNNLHNLTFEIKNIYSVIQLSYWPLFIL